MARNRNQSQDLDFQDNDFQDESPTPNDTEGTKGGRARAGTYGDDTGSEGMNNDRDTPYGFDDET